MVKNKTITTEMILAKKGLADKTPTPFYSDYFDGEIIVENTHPQSFYETMQAGANDEIYAYSKLIYENCPMFRDKILLTEFEVDDPYSLPQKIYGANVCELLMLGNYILQCYGNVAKKTEDIKKK